MPTNPAPASQSYAEATLAFRLIRLLVRGLFKLLFKIKVEGLTNLPREGGYIIAGNHLSWLDPFLILAYAPVTPRIYLIGAEEEVFNPPWRRFFTEKIGGVIPVDRYKPSVGRDILEKVGAVLQGGGVLAIFPEGEVSPIETGQLLPLKKGTASFAVRYNVPIVPIAFSGTKELWLGKRVSLIVGQPLHASSGGKAAVQSQTEKLAAAIQELLPPPALPVSGPKIFRNFLTNLFIQEENELRREKFQTQQQQKPK